MALFLRFRSIIDFIYHCENARERLVNYRILVIIAATGLGYFTGVARAQSSYPTPNGIDRAPSTAIVIPNGSGIAMPPSVSNPLVVGAVPQGVSFSSCSGTIAATNVPQLVMSVNAARHYLVVDNPTSNSMSLGLDATVTLTTGLPLYSNGGGYEWASEVPTNAIYVVGTAGSQFVCWQG